MVDPAELLNDRRRKALDLNDDVVQLLAAALLALDLGRVDETRTCVEQALKASQAIVAELVRGDHGEIELGPGKLSTDHDR